MGIGRETVIRLLNKGCRVSVWDSKGEALEELKASMDNPNLHISVLDIRDREQVLKRADELLKEYGSPDYLINNAGVMRKGTFLQGSDEDWDLTMDVNFKGILNMTRAFLPAMYERDSGHIINISSAAGLLGVSGLSVYAASKWAVHGFTDSLREEAHRLKKAVKFSSIHPFYIASGLFEGAKVRGLGNLLVPRVKNHGVIADAIVDKAIIKGHKKIYRPRSLKLVDIMKGIFPFPLFVMIMRILKVQESMDTHQGYKENNNDR